MDVRVWVSVLVLFLACGGAFAQGVCPPGYYAIQGNGITGCAPVSGVESAPSPAQPPPQRSRPVGEWLRTWGSLVRGEDGSGWVALGETSENAANKAALDKCASVGENTNCTVFVTFTNQCGATARNGDDAAKVWFARSPHESVSKDMALSDCREAGMKECKITWVGCSDPIFVRY